MITNIKILEKYCTDYNNIENYEEALKSPLKYDLHHRLEISDNKSASDLIDENLYYHRPPEELIFLEHGEHQRLHKKGENNPMFGKNLSAETRQKISDANKGENNPMFGKPGPWLGKNLSAETRQKISEALKGVNHKGENNPMFGKNMSAETRKRLSEAHSGKHWHLEDGHRIWTD